jgi:uncharacterized protein YceH (UPF0502 family)
MNLAFQLSQIEARVLGCLVEKETTTPDYYPLSLNALTAACNQKSNREPVMTLDEATVAQAIDTLNEKGLAYPISSSESRVRKYAHRLQEVFNFDRREMAVLCVLLLRGPQTPGELRGRTERMYKFDDLEAVESSLHHLMERDPPLVTRLPRLPGTKETRYVHLLAGDAAAWEAATVTEQPAPARGSTQERIEKLEAQVQVLERQVEDLTNQLADFRKQFE